LDHQAHWQAKSMWANTRTATRQYLVISLDDDLAAWVG
jgi:hypothetical protein